MLQPRWSPGSLAGELAIAETIAARDLNNLYLTSCFFREEARYAGFCALYALMRVIDDRIDSLPAAAKSSPASIATERAVVDAWERALLARVADAEAVTDDAACDHESARVLLRHAANATRRLGVPAIVWREFFDAMRRDIEVPSLFPTFADYLDYTQGASVAPTTIYLYILACNLDAGARSVQEHADYLAALGQALGRFAYLGHVVRDLPQDAVAGERGLWYVSREDLDAFGLDEAAVRHDVAQGRSRPQLVALVSSLVARAWGFNRASRSLLASNPFVMRPDCAFVLELIIRLYENVLRKVEGCAFDVLQGRHQLTKEEKWQIALDVARDHGL